MEGIDAIPDWIKTIVETMSLDNNRIDVQIVCERIQNNELSIEKVVIDLGPFLTNVSNTERIKGLNILSSILNSLPNDLLSRKHVEHLAHFYCDRLKDHHSVVPHVFSGLLAVVDSLNFDKSLSQTIFNGLVKEISVQQYSVSDRFLVFQLLSLLLERHLKEFTSIRSEFIYGLIQLIEGEADPRCLLLVFRLTNCVIKSIDLDPYTEDVFEVISCYFPVLFTPPPNDEYGITRKDLSEGLHRCFSSSSSFAQFLFPLVLEKLESELSTAKCDSFEVISIVCPNYGYEYIKQFIPQLWTAIRVDAFRPKLEDNEVSELALKALTSISDTIMASNQSNIDSFIQLIWSDISNAFNKPELDLMESAVDIVLATVSSNVYAFNLFVDKIIPILLKQFTFCQKESISILIIDSISTILSHSQQLSPKAINIINSESLFTLLSSLSVADSESGRLRGSVISCLNQLIKTIELNANQWKVVSKVLRTLLDNCFDCEDLVPNTYSLLQSIASLNPQLTYKLMESVVNNFDPNTGYSTEANRKRLKCTLNAYEFVSSEFNSFKLISDHLVEQIKSNSYYVDPNQELYSLDLTKSLWNCINRRTKDKSEENVLFLYNECYDRLIQHCIHVSICTDNKSGTVVNMKLMNSLFAIIGKGVSKLDSHYGQQLFDKSSQFSVFGKVDQLLRAVPPTCFCTYVIGPQFLDTLNGTQASIVFGLINALLSNANYKCGQKDSIDLFDKLLAFAVNNKYENLNICQTVAQTIGAFVNRFDAKNDGLNDKIKHFLIFFEERLNNSEESNENLFLLINAFIWITKGLVIGGHPVRKDFIALINRLFEHKNKLIRDEISKAFAIIHGSDECRLTPENNAIVRLLYHQSFFLETFDTLFTGYMKHKSEESDKKENYLTALLTQLSFIPKAVFRTELIRLLPMLLDAIRCESSQTNQMAALDAVTQLMVDKNQQILNPSLKSTVNNCVDLSLSSPYLKVRRSALNCLAQITDSFDDLVLNYLRDEVVRGLRKALNDKKRVVRRSAVSARCKWILIGQPGGK